MLQTLQIKNFALIEQLHIDFSDRLSIITGETGAGKSILLGALGLVLGNRADLTSLKDKEKKCVVEAHFKVSNYNLKDFFLQNDLDYEAVTIIRREILPSGKSRAFVNDSPVNLQELQQLGNYLIDIHSQQQTRELSDEQYQMQIVDAIAGNADLIATYKKQLSAFKSLQSQLTKAKGQKADLAKEQDYNTFLLQELLDAKLKAGEQEELESELEKLSNVEFIKESLAKAITLTNEEQAGALQTLKEIKTALQKVSTISQEYNSFFERISSLVIELDDVTAELSQNFELLVDDPARLALINQKLQLIYTLQKKHNVATVEELITIQNDLEGKVLQSDELETAIEKLEKEIDDAKTVIDEAASELSEKRKTTIPVLTEKITTMLSQLGMPNARFQFKVTHTDSYYATGKDTMSLLFSANKGTDFGLLKKVASGGEMSRIMLSVKAVLAEYSKLPTIIFDEIDTGVSGEISNKMGDIMKAMSRGMQVFAITHLPQIAAKGDHHYKVFKITQGENTVSELKLLSKDERIREIAEMLSGKDITDSALNHAKALLN
ncbi:DNA repair protein RecN [Flavobacterium salilacus subsp. salilacus]|uniref:DNA repair protein RecN n=1 Tax=Flavobacterium TaxID=237 RepID=UPI00107521E0|nr:MULTISPECIES: DNA repair protein RecN [Flavobacterium]KAF2517507.1 DNA repair protein RecN [Flavobacterium salilacus subsp. salilacus]MBE1615655.1 DNA repair protein RecN [Flavobacterium sp. SaA2.13]